MKNQTCKGSEGYTLIELLVVISIIGALASIAIPHYLNNRQKAQGAACQSNRRNIEAAEITYFVSSNIPNLSIGNNYSCPSGGVYVWLVSDPKDPDYPKVACSVHYAGSPVEEVDEPVEKSLTETVNDLIKTVKALDLKVKGKDGEGRLVKKLEDAIKEYDKGKISKADNNLDSFKKEVKKNKKIDAEDKTTLIKMADEIQKMLK
ncbi:type IV pilin protein [Thermodesulfobacteriota bacterium]